MNRRSFLSGIAASSFLPSLVLAQSSAHPFARLINPDTGHLYEPQAGKFTLAMFMSAQESYPSCGGAFIGVHQALAYMRRPDKVQPVIVMPKISDQSNTNDYRNLQRAKSSEVDFTILTGDLGDVLAAADMVDGAFFERDNNGKVSGHTLDAFFLTPSGRMIFHHRAEDNFTLTPLVDRAIQVCESVFARNRCL